MQENNDSGKFNETAAGAEKKEFMERIFFVGRGGWIFFSKEGSIQAFEYQYQDDAWYQQDIYRCFSAGCNFSYTQTPLVS